MPVSLSQMAHIEDSVSTDWGSASSPASSLSSDSGPDPDAADPCEEFDDFGHSKIHSSTRLQKGLRSYGRSTFELAIDAGRLWSDIHHSAQWGAIPNSPGMARLALSDEDKLVRDYFVRQAIIIGCQVNIDEMGNIFAVLAGENNDIPPIGMGSHLDTQPAGRSRLVEILYREGNILIYLACRRQI